MYPSTALKNGIRLVTHELPNRDSVSIGFWVGVGGRYEPDRIKGIAHFLEHIVFKGSKKYSCDEVKQKIEGVGGALNAFTSEEQTCFYAKIPSKFIDSTFDVLSDMVFNPRVYKKDVLKEQAVIIEEIKMYKDLSQYFVIELLDGLVWPKHPLGGSLAGSIATVSGMGRKDLLSFHKNAYGGRNVVVAACGDITHKRLTQLSQKHLKDVPTKPQLEYIPSKTQQDRAQSHFFVKKIEQVHLAFGVEGYDENHPDRYAMSLLSILLGGNMSSRLFVELREKRGLAYSVSSSVKTLHDTGLFLIRAGVDINKAEDTVAVIVKELQKICRYTVKEDEFKRAKDYLVGQLLLGLEDTMDHMLWLGEAVVSRNKTEDYHSVIKKFQKVTLTDIKRVARDLFNPTRFNLAAVGPLSTKQQKNIKQILQAG